MVVLCRCTKRKAPPETYSDVSVFGLQTIYVVVSYRLLHLITVNWEGGGG